MLIKNSKDYSRGTIEVLSGKRKGNKTEFDFFFMQSTFDRDGNRFNRIIFCQYTKAIPPRRQLTAGKVNITAVYFLDQINSTEEYYKGIIKSKRCEIENKHLGEKETILIEKENHRVFVKDIDFIKNVKDGID